ncbi:hypothetical protein LPJ73_001142 [Coemansia sp. RSA 2703]|nr:hypothetical protein LPJ73_001142 [Coemansia sp. RSA 2703]KAJ2372442.1 hypothetical protein IW150_004113 [Coemansia sp. RSA 2607]KAJ2395943.1 hypothetical protein GGI05_001354 [Coemansia sp. RSA 2603]
MGIFSTVESYEISGKVALVTGALGTIGTQITLLFLELGAKVIMVDIIGDGSGEEICSALNSETEDKNGKRAIYIQADLRKPEEIQRILKEGTAQFGHIDVLVNNAGLALYKRFYVDEESDTISAAIDLNLKTPMESTRLFVHMLKESGREGVIVNMASIAGLAPVKSFETYGTTKTALIFFTKASKYLAPKIRVTAVAPFFVNSPMAFKDGKVDKITFVNKYTLVSAKDVAHAVVKQVQDRGSGGKTNMVIGRWNSIPVWQFSASNVYLLFVVFFCWFVGIARSYFGLPSGSDFLRQEESFRNAGSARGQKKKD